MEEIYAGPNLAKIVNSLKLSDAINSVLKVVTYQPWMKIHSVHASMYNVIKSHVHSHTNNVKQERL